MKKATAIASLLLIPYFMTAQPWSLNLSRPDLEFSALEFPDVNTGFAFADSSVGGTFVTGVVLRTSDAGLSWSTTTLGNPNYRITKVHFLNVNEGFAAGRNGGGNNGLFLKTADGGVTWGGASFFSERLFSVCFINPSTGWVMGKNGLLSRTTDGGLTWTAQNVTSEDINDMRFFNGTQGVMVCDGPEIYITSDGGQSWNFVASPVNDDLVALDIYYANAWACGAGGALIASVNFGAAWTAQSPAAPVDFIDIDVADGLTGFVGGLAGFMNRTTDGGSSWQNEATGCMDDITALSVPDASHGWFATAAGDLYTLNAATGIEPGTVSGGSITVWPSPATGHVFLSAPNFKTGPCTIRIRGLQGSVCRTWRATAIPSTARLEIGDLDAGIYVVEFSTETGIFRCRFVKAD